MYSITRNFAIVYGEFEAIHYWQNAPESESYLRNEHRHLFKVRVRIDQLHGDRDIEYYNFKKWLNEKFREMKKPVTFSCEQYCVQISNTISTRYPDRYLIVEVTEDGFEGAEVHFFKSIREEEKRTVSENSDAIH